MKRAVPMSPLAFQAFLSLAEAAQRLDRCPVSVRRLVKRNLLPRDPNSRHIAIPAWAIKIYVERAGVVEPYWWNRPGFRKCVND